jgi:membrane protein DedA with SNARE-associated domain
MKNLWVLSPIAMGILLAEGVDANLNHNQTAFNWVLLLSFLLLEGLLYRILKNQDK